MDLLTQLQLEAAAKRAQEPMRPSPWQGVLQQTVGYPQAGAVVPPQAVPRQNPPVLDPYALEKFKQGFRGVR